MVFLIKIICSIYFDFKFNKTYFCIMAKKLSFWVIILLLGLVTAYFYFLNPVDKSNFFLPCFFYEITGYKCPGCGTQRAFHEVLHFNLAVAFRQNALFVLSIPYVLVATFFNFKKEKYPKMNEFLLGNKTLLALLVIVILFGVFRNL